MTEERRPIGLTALAVLSFILCVWWIRAVYALVYFLRLRGDPAAAALAAEEQRALAALAQLPGWFLPFSIATGVAKTFLFLVAGAGYLQMKRIWGRIVGSALAVLMLLETAILFSANPSLHPGTLVSVAYAVATLYLLNRTYAALLVR